MVGLNFIVRRLLDSRTGCYRIIGLRGRVQMHISLQSSSINGPSSVKRSNKSQSISTHGTNEKDYNSEIATCTLSRTGLLWIIQWTGVGVGFGFRRVGGLSSMPWEGVGGVVRVVDAATLEPVVCVAVNFVCVMDKVNVATHWLT